MKNKKRIYTRHLIDKVIFSAIDELMTVVGSKCYDDDFIKKIIVLLEATQEAAADILRDN